MSGRDLEELVGRFAALIDQLGGAGPALEHLVEEAEKRGRLEPVLAEVRKLELGPQDVLLVQFQREIAQPTQAELQRTLSSLLGGAKVLILDTTVSAVVAREGHA